MTRLVFFTGARVAHWAAALALLVVLLNGCAYRPTLLPLAESAAAAGRRAFREMVAGQGGCVRAVDAEATVTFNLPWQSGSIGGYLQLMAPGYLKFIAVNPLGQPLLLLGSDGAGCRYILPAERRVYDGSLAEGFLSGFFPRGFEPARSYYWLIGRLRPGQVRIGEVNGDPAGAGLWVKFRYEGEAQAELALFDPQKQRLLRHLLLDQDGATVLDVGYDSYTTAACPLPGLVTIRGDNRFGKLVLRLGNWLPADTLTAADFTVTAPSDFVRTKIK